MLLLLAACASPAPDDTDTGEADSGQADSGDADTGDTGEDVELPPVQVVTLTAADGVQLVGDYYGHQPGAEAVLLLHMIPPTYDRSTWPLAFIEALRADGYAVLALDRRGAGDSGGVATDAYTGPAGVLDAEAAAAFLGDEGAGGLVFIGASNGTTTCLDYAVGGQGPPLRAMIWMSPGNYTENNHEVAELDLDALLLVYPRSEAAWSEDVAERVDTADRWTYLEYRGNAHGTMLFDGDDDVSGDLRAWLGAAR